VNNPSELDEVAVEICLHKRASLLGPVGGGSFKQTYHIRTANDEHFALKIYRPESFDQRAVREVDVMRRCSHPCVARLFLADLQNYKGKDYAYVIEEFLPGGTLTDRLQRGGPLSPGVTYDLGALLIDALAQLHNLQIVHRDLKPDNIMFRNQDMTPVITDFGIARDIASTSLTPTFAPFGPGTPGYAAPEQMKNEKSLQDWRCDQFALGIVLAIATFSFHPYDEGGLTVNEVVQRIANCSSPASRFMANADGAGLPALKVMVAPWPASRYRTPPALAEAWAQQRK
jgi:serine/threonine protein kinase